MSNSNLISIGSTATKFDILQDEDGDFLWVIDFFQGETDAVEQDISDDDFEFILYNTDGTTPLITLGIGTGITLVDDNTISISIELEDYTGITPGCKYPYMLRQTTAAGQRKPLFKGKYINTK